MKIKIKYTYELSLSDIAQALAEWVNLHSCGESHLDEEAMDIEWLEVGEGHTINHDMTGVKITSD